MGVKNSPSLFPLLAPWLPPSASASASPSRSFSLPPSLSPLFSLLISPPFLSSPLLSFSFPPSLPPVTKTTHTLFEFQTIPKCIKWKMKAVSYDMPPTPVATPSSWQEAQWFRIYCLSPHADSVTYSLLDIRQVIDLSLPWFAHL